MADEVELRRAAPMSASRHRAFVRKRLGVVHDAARVRQVAEEAIRTEVNTGFFQTVTGRLDAAARTVAREAIELEAGTPERSVLEAMIVQRPGPADGAAEEPAGRRLGPAIAARS
ncbi:hypothetical protein ABGB14_37610 [Nonomuraea sp. B10E15]|uniref:hypothetical protein n=1 Tax=Nonomuraea sp. B10E15 TaxID=3153560 RepID=UPI00325D046C